ncbi:MAG TPA: TIM barrel protein [Armatimonadota bacterium]|nr:TIM barrel protein [Armatimonadota bacterium]
MRFGCCVDLGLIETAARAGCDFVELPASVLCPEQGESDFRPVRERLARAPIRAEVWELCLQPDLKICGASVDWPRVSRYVSTALNRIAAVGGAVVGFPCGESCEIPPGFSTEDALAQISDFLRVCGVVARRHGLIVGIEALPARPSSPIGSVPEAMELAHRLNMPEVGIVPNCFEMARAEQSLLDVADASAWLAHVHVSAADLNPAPGADEHLPEFIHALRLADYGGRISIQAEWKNPDEEMGRALEALRLCFGED